MELTKERIKEIRTKYNLDTTPTQPEVKERTARDILDEIRQNKAVEQAKSEDQAIADKKAQDPMRQGIVGKTLGAGSDFLSAVVRAPVRAMTSVGLDMAAGITGLATGKNVRAEYQPKSTLERIVFGDESIRGIGLKQQERQDYFMEKGANPWQAIGLAATLTGLETATDLAPIGAEKIAGKTSETLTRATLNAQRSKVLKAADDVVGIIAQGKKADLPKAKRALQNVLSTVDPKTIKTADDLVGVLDGNIKGVSQAIDNVLILDKTKYKNVAPVSQALDDIAKLGEATRDSGIAQTALAQKNKLVSEGLTSKEINDIARVYGNEFGQKAFSKRTGEALAGVNAQAYENTRSSLKEYVRQSYDNEALKTLDSYSADMFRTRDLLKQSSEAVNKASQKATQGGVPLIKDMPGRKVTLGNFIDSTLGALRGKPFTWKGWEKELNKNLMKLKRANALEGKNFADEVGKLFWEASTGKKQPLMLQSGVSEFPSVKAPINLPAKAQSTIAKEELDLAIKSMDKRQIFEALNRLDEQDVRKLLTEGTGGFQGTPINLPAKSASSIDAEQVRRLGGADKGFSSPAVGKTADEIKNKLSNVFRLMGNDVEDVSIIGSTARGKIKPNDLDILVTPKKSLGNLTSDKLNDRIELQKILEKEVKGFFPDKDVHITISKYDESRGPKISLDDFVKKPQVK